MISVNKITAVCLLACFTIAFLLLVLDIHYVNQPYAPQQLRLLFLVSDEASIGSWYSVILAFLVSLVLLVTALRSKLESTSAAWLAWGILALLLM